MIAYLLVGLILLVLGGAVLTLMALIGYACGYWAANRDWWDAYVKYLPPGKQ